MKKLLTLLACCFLSVPSFGVEWIRDKIYVSLSYGGFGVNYDIGYYYYDVGYHYTDNIKISVGSVVNSSFKGNFFFAAFFDEKARSANFNRKARSAELALMAKLHYHYKFESMDIAPYIIIGMGAGIRAFERPRQIIETYEQSRQILYLCVEDFFSYQIGSGINLPLSERTSVFAGYKLQRFHKVFHGIELGMSFNL